MAKKYELPPNWEKTCDGQECICMAHGAWDCVCDNVDWTPREVYELRLEVNSLIKSSHGLLWACKQVVGDMDLPSTEYSNLENAAIKRCADAIEEHEGEQK